ncbi:uncharacterized protein LOC129911179 isoform X2 [Episyrphus balteatus]|uniref:uncharacterized protein LOC129911179 isoform X2 n=1 Tax=Episyrphus balteatus TaxID=286459 RepID=UPI0024851DF8|nr:uncharacterized protein LOC129911179 isoform X2 [Episyrphus balteatus]
MATKLVIYLLFFGLYTVQIGGQMTSDPAPGRSPGPPGGITTIDDDAHGSSGNIKSTTLLLTKDPTEIDDDDDENSDATGEYTSDSELSKLNEIKPDEDDLPPSLLEDDDDDDENVEDENDDEVIHHSGGTINVHNESPTGGAGGDGNGWSHGGNNNDGSSSSKPCVNELSEFLNDAIVVDKDNVDAVSVDGKNATTEEMFAEAKRIHIQLEVMHDIFDTKEGLNCGLLYRVRLRSSLVDGTPLAGEFFAETLSEGANSKKRGHFVEHSLGGNKSPISWLKAPQQNVRSGGVGAAGVNWASENYRGATVAEGSRSRTTFITGSQGVTNTFQPFASQWTENVRNSLDEDSGMEGDTKCSGDNTWHGKNEIADVGNGGYSTLAKDKQRVTESQNLWILNEFCDQADDIVEFRIFFRPAKRGTINHNINRRQVPPSSHMVVFKTVFSLKIVKDCQLTLRETSGTLDYTTLPLYSTDCTVHFPSFQMATLGQLPPGILVELTRLNVPCNNEGYLKFSNRSQLCGKLEELTLSERTYHFDVLRKTSVKIYKNPMFSLNYKLVDFCYNVSLNNESGQFYVRPTRPDTFECYFRIHLPYGNRIQLQLVTNNDSDVVNSNSNPSPPSAEGATTTTTITTSSSTTTTTTTQMAANDRDATTIYTSLGLSIENNIVNLSLSSQNEVFDNRTMMPESLSRSPSDSNINNLYNSNTGFASDESSLMGKIPAECHGVVIKIFENDSAKWTHCVNSTSDVSGFFVESSGNTLNVHLFRPVRLKVFSMVPPEVASVSGQQDEKDTNELAQLPSIYLSYATKPIAEIVADCAFGWIALQQFCVCAIEKPQPWVEGEKHCASLGGHLASIRSKLEQSIIDNLLINSPGYHDHFAYWVGGSDKNFEGDFRWTDGLPFQYTNWFPGWSQHGNYNKQPNDDGLSSQDCIELRRYFRTPPGIQSTRSPMTNNFMWNDRDCNANNFIICERPMSDETFRKNWVNDCNKTVSLTKEHPRAAVWSPSFPRQYPDNANCFTTITAPSGYRIVLEFEELVIENEPGCTYDYLEVTEPTINSGTSNPHLGNFNIEQKFTKSSSRHNNNNNNNNKLKIPPFASSGILNTNSNRDFQKRSSYENPSLSFTSSSMNANSFNNFNIAQSNYQNLLNIFSNLYKPHANFLIQTPDYPKGNTYYPTGKNSKNDDLPKRLCGDWSSKLKLLRHISGGSYLGLHFVSDYSHHFGGYKAKAFMENRSHLRGASECANERLRPYNGSCYLFVSYPEADWWTAQQVCRGMGAKLSSVSSADEHKFITSNIRNHIDYSPQLVYWLGAELEKSGQFEWTDDTKMSFQGWLPGQGQFDEIPHDATCLGLQWKMSPTPMLPSGLYWQSQKCNRVGGYVCKKPKESFSEYALSNSTVMGTEGRLISPAYPNAYPHNIDYWIHIRAPERTRIIVQFQKIDLEAQDECLYDFISIQNYELVSKISLEPGTNPIPMAMFADEREFNEVHYESNHIASSSSYTRQTRSLPPLSSTGAKVHSVTTKSTDEDLMTQPDMQMRTVLDTLVVASVADIRNNRLQQDDSETFNSAATTAADSDNSWKKSKPPPASLNDNGNHANKVLLNPKRHRRKNHQDIENKLPQQRKAKASEEEELQQRHHHHHLSKRSTILRSIPPADNAQSFLPYVRWCGSHDSNMSKFDFVSSSNQVVLNFHSDYSVTGLGFAAVWKAIDMSGCPMQTLTSREGTVLSPNYPHFLLNNLNCAYVIQAPMGRRVWLEFIEYDLLSDTLLEVDIGNGYFRPFRTRNHVNEGIFVSIREQIRVQLRTGQRPRGRGFQAVYHTVAQMEKDRVINLTNNFTGYLYQLNYPHNSPENVDFTQHLVAPFGDNILLELHGVEFSDNGCPGNNVIEIYDNYADYNGTKWQLCKYPNLTQLDDEQYVSSTGNKHQEHQQQQQQQQNPDYPLEPQLAPVYITSYLNTLHIRQRTYSKSDINLNGTVRIQQDNNYKLKLASGDKSVESCQLNPCQFNGKCVAKNGKNHCQCQGHYTGRFCGLNSCELEPCVFGKCELTATNFKCHCQTGYQGNTCEHKIRPCADNPCEGRGACFEKNGGFFCRCHAWWEGHRCERRMLHIPYKPLSERMLQEPFWLGLITVFVVLLAIGLVWCAKRHFPEKIEKLLAEEADRNRPPGSVHGHHHHTSLREQLQFTTAIPQTTTNIAPGAPRSIFNRLGIRKPSLLSLSSPNPTGGATARTFSLDDLLRPPPRRSPSPRKKRNNSTPVKKNAAEKKQILQQLVSPAANPPKPKVSLGELIQMSENRLRAASTQDSESGDKETTFSENSGSAASSSAAVAVTSAISDPKLEKKVTFARLLNKVSAEMSSGSEMDVGHFTRNSSALSLPTDIQFRASSMPPSPCTNDMRSPHSTSSNQGSDSLSSSDLALTDIGMRNIMQFQNSRNRTRPKVSSADSILAMFRNFASTTTTASNTATIPSNSSMFASPSTTPTASSPQDDVPGDDESSTTTSSMHTPVSFSSGAPDSPVFYRQTTIEVPVLDALSAHKSSPTNSNLLHPPTILLEIPSNGINKCLSPIREMPTPIPSPALTPIMPRPQRSISPIFQDDQMSESCSDDDDRSSDNQISASIFLDLGQNENFMSHLRESENNTPTEMYNTTFKADVHNQMSYKCRLPQSSMPTLKQQEQQQQQQQQKSSTFLMPSITIDIEPPTPEEKQPRPRDLVIPTLTVEQPSPTKNRFPMIIFPGSPPPQRASIGETSFMFPNKQQQKRLLKQFEKPTSLDLQFVPPTITITSNMSELESDTEPLSPAPKAGGPGSLLAPGNPVGMCYLSPFTMCSRADRTISESNLSSSGYSSMASPGPSRCGSSNPLCPNEMDEPGSGHSGPSLSLHASLLSRRKNAALASCKENITNGKHSAANEDHQERLRARSDSETMSDDILLESNDEGIGTDHVDEKIDDNRNIGNRNGQQLGVFVEEQILIEVDEPSPAPVPAVQMAQLQLPSIVIQIDGTDKGLSPVSSRSESPLSERAGMGRFSPHFYGRKDQLPFTDSDGLYDFPSSDGKAGTYTHQRRSSSKKRERKLSKSSCTQSPTKNQQNDVSVKDSSTPTTSSHVCSKHCRSYHHSCPVNAVTARKSPKRRPVNRHTVASSSSSSESLTSTKDLTVRSMPRRLNSPNREKRLRKHDSNSEDDAADALLRRISPSIVVADNNQSQPRCKINRLRAIGNQIRFLRRLEKSIKTRERLVSPSDSCAEENTDDLDSPQATSPLLQPTSPNRTKVALCRQNRIPPGSYSLSNSNVLNPSNWKTRDRGIITADDVNSD